MNDEGLSPRATMELIFALILIISCTVFYYNWNESKQELATYKLEQKAKETADGINKPMDEVDKRESEIYPKINADIAQINKNIKAINETVKRLERNQITKEQAYDTFKNKNIYEISQYLRDSGINNSVIGR